LVTIVLLVQRRGSSGAAGESARAATSSSGIPLRSSRSRLVVRQGASAGLVIPLTCPVTRVGRAQPFADAVIVDEYVSNPHFSIEIDAGRFFIMDEASTNGTRVNGLALRPHQRIPIDAPAMIEAGQTRLEFVPVPCVRDEDGAALYLMSDLDDVSG
jgi:pSer/pThr/pTyr-binding forkhead associated (FHA) protein